MHKKIVVVGTGYVGLITAVGLADFGNQVTGVDIDTRKIECLNNGIPTIYEAGLETYLKRNLKSGRLRFTTQLAEAVRQAELVVIAVGTPADERGKADLSQLQNALVVIGDNLNTYKVIVTKSTVPLGTNRRIGHYLAARAAPGLFDVVSNPEFLRQGRAIQDFFHPDRIVIGAETERVRELLKDVYRPLYLIQTPFIWCDLQTAELIKYANNAFLALKITYINQLANLADAVNADIHTVAAVMGMDGRISPKFLHPGPGYGGSCFPKDTRALVECGTEYGVELSLVREVITANLKQKRQVVEKLKKMTGPLAGRSIALLGLAFKSETDDVRESPAITIVECLLQEGAAVNVHDPQAAANFRKIFPEGMISYFDDKYDAVDGADAVIFCTEWNEYRNLDLFRLKKNLRRPIILDLRNILDPGDVAELQFVYQGVGRAPMKVCAYPVSFASVTGSSAYN